MTTKCRNGNHPIDARTLAAGGEVCFDCATNELGRPLNDDQSDSLIAAFTSVLPSATDRELIDLLNAVRGFIAGDSSARLIAAAPEMREAIADLFEHCAMVHKYWGEGNNAKQATAAVERARALLARIDGTPDDDYPRASGMAEDIIKASKPGPRTPDEALSQYGAAKRARAKP